MKLVKPIRSHAYGLQVELFDGEGNLYGCAAAATIFMVGGAFFVTASFASMGTLLPVAGGWLTTFGVVISICT